MDLKEKLKEHNIDIEQEDVRNRLIIILMGTVFAIFVGLVNYAVGLNSIINIAIVLCIFIVLAGVIAYTWEEKKERIAEKEASSSEAIEEASSHVQEVEIILSALQKDLSECKEKVKVTKAKIPKSISEKVEVLEKLEERLDSRVQIMNKIIESRKLDRLDEIPVIAKSDIAFLNDSANVLITQKKLPDLAFEQLETTVSTLVERINAELASL